jgi:DTW domain-containing protein YfiP
VTVSPTGNSDRPLAVKLGITPGMTVILLDAPDGAAEMLEPLPDAVTIRRAARGRAHVVILFVTRRAELARRIMPLATIIHPDRALWVVWPKRTARVATDLTENTVRDVALPVGLVDTKVCAIDATWSALRFVWRRSSRVS